MLIALLFAAYAYATPAPATPMPVSPASLNHIRHLQPALRPGATARINAQGANVPCWDSPASLTAFTQAYESRNQAAVAIQVAGDSLLLEEGTRVRSLATQGLLGQIVRLKILDGDHAGSACYIQSSLRIYTGIKSPKPATKK